MRALIALAIIAPALALAAGLSGHPYVAPQPEPTFSLIGVGGGHEYIIDTGLTADDCRYYVSAYDMRFTHQYCELEPIAR